MECILFLAIDNLKIEIIPVTPIYQNCMVIWNKNYNQGIVTDPGADTGLILSVIEAYKLKIKAILLTHGHFDHVGGAVTLKDKLEKEYNQQVPILGPGKEDQFLLSRVIQDADYFGFGSAEIKNVTSTRFLQDREQLNFDGFSFETIHLPGHTPGHVVFYESKARLVITGDTLFKGTIGRTDWDYGDGALLLKGVKERLLTLGDDVYVLPGHGMSSKIGIEKKTNPLLV